MTWGVEHCYGTCLRGAALEKDSATLLTAAKVGAEQMGDTSLYSVVANQAKVSALMQRGGRAPALVKLVMWLGEELEVTRDKILPRGFRSPFGPSLERRIFQASHKIVLTTTQFNAGIPVVSSSSYIGIILSAFLTLRRKRAMSLTKVWMDWRSWLEGFSRERREGIRMHP